MTKTLVTCGLECCVDLITISISNINNQLIKEVAWKVPIFIKKAEGFIMHLLLQLVILVSLNKFSYLPY